MGKKLKGIHILLSGKGTSKYSPFDLAQIAAEHGAAVVQLREKEMPMDELLPIARKMRAICRDITFIVNDRADLVKIIEADGVHLGQDDLPIEYAREILGDSSVVGISCGSLLEAKAAEKSGADYIGFGHLFPTYSKIKSSPPKTMHELEVVCNTINIPVIAIGGITPANATGVFKISIAGVAVLGAFTNSANPELVLNILIEISKKNNSEIYHTV